MTRAVFPGTFDPITRGHEVLARRASAVFDELIVGVAAGVHKTAFFSLDERLQLVRQAFFTIDNITVLPFEGLLASFMNEQHSKVIVRGIRVISDFEFEAQLADINKMLDNTLETVFFLPDREYVHLSSTMVREIARLGGDIDKFVSPAVAAALRAKAGL